MSGEINSQNLVNGFSPDITAGSLEPDQEALFLAQYPRETMIRMPSGKEWPLGFLIDNEKKYCTAAETAREEPQARVKYLAKLLSASEKLHPDHAHLIEEAP